MPYDTTLYHEQKAAGVRSSSGQTRLTKLTGKHFRIINFHLQGMKGTEIARLMGMTGTQVSLVLNDPLARAVIQSRFIDIDNEMYARSHTVVAEAMNSKDPAIALRGADMVWRARGRFEKKESDKLGAEDLVRMMLERVGPQGQASITVTTSQVSPPSDPCLTLDHEP